MNGQTSACQSAGDRCVAFHGELYNAASLRRHLDVSDDASLGRLLLTAFERWSVGCVSHLEGQFVLALRDGDRLHLYRDGSGARNLYFSAQAPGRIAFATRLDTLFRLPGVERRLDRRAIHEYLRLLEIAAPNTLFEGIQALEAGQLLTWSTAGIRIARPVIAQPAPGIVPSYAEAADALEALLRQSIAARLADAAKPAAFLSGGVDSSLLCAMAARVSPELTAVTVGFDHPRLDETPIAQAVARHLGIRHEVLRFARQDYVRAFEAFARGAEQPMADPALPPTLLAFGHCRDHYDLALDGSGADEIFGAVPPRHVRVAFEYAAGLPPGLRRTILGALRRLPRLAGYAPIFDFEHPAELALRWHGFTRPEVESLCGEPVSFEHTLFYRTFARFPRRAHIERYSALMDALTCDRLRHAASITGLTVRYPYWDRSVDEYVRALPLDYRQRPDEAKRLLRALLARHVPREIWDVPKHGFDFPLLEFLQAEDFLLVRRYLARDSWDGLGLLAPERVEDYARRFMAGEHRLVFRVWALAVLAAWLEAHPD
jgi:asparagine synthase (glutamine-hydrolysing)